MSLDQSGHGGPRVVKGLTGFTIITSCLSPSTAYSTALPLPADQGLTTQLRPVPPTDGALKTSRRPIEIAADNEAIRMMEGGDGLEDFTTLEFKMHQIVR